MRGAGDVDGDGFADVLVGAPGEDSLFPGVGGYYPDYGTASLFSGATGELLHEWPGRWGGSRAGWSVAGAGDVDGDGVAEVLIGAPATASQYYSGEVIVFGLSTGTPGRVRTRGAACAGASGALPRIGHRGDAVLDTDLAVLVRGADAGAGAALLFGDPTELSLDLIGMQGCSLYALPFFDLAAGTNPRGYAEASFHLPLQLAPVGHVLDLQWAVIAPGANALGVTTSNALSLTIGSR